MTAAEASAQTDGTPSAATPTTLARAPYLRRGDEVEQRYQVHRERLERFFNTFGSTLDKDAPELRQAIMPPAPVPFGYQILPILKADPPPARSASRFTLSPFSWSRTDSMVSRGEQRLSALEARLDNAVRADSDARRNQYQLIVDEYKKLVDGQKLMASTVQYNRLWQSEIARFTQRYRDARILQDDVVTRQALLDSLSHAGEHRDSMLRARADSLTRRIAEAIRKSATPDFVRRDHPSAHEWILSVPLYTDIVDSAFVESARAAIEDGWYVRDGEDEFRVMLDVRRVRPSQLYPNGEVPANGAHIVIPEHVKRFPPDGAVLTTGGNLTYLFGRSIILGPHSIAHGTLVHEFGHILGFKDAYFRSFEDGGEDGYKVLEVILGPDDDLGVPANGRATRQHFEVILQEKPQ
ncbi:MAG TPA: hypothetical protein VES88_18385 [Gemmatimonadaceae bacterium]|nr:hypothetical protein [Gemmatimonadaceae bacterium]